MSTFGLKIHEKLFLVAGLFTLLGVLFPAEIEATWVFAKTAYTTGVVFFTIHTVRDVRN